MFDFSIRTLMTQDNVHVNFSHALCDTYSHIEILYKRLLLYKPKHFLTDFL